MMTDTRWRWPVILDVLDTLELAGYKRSDDDAHTGRAIGLLWSAARIYAGEMDEPDAVPVMPLAVSDLAKAEADRRDGRPAAGKTPGQVAWEAFCKATGFLPPPSRWEAKPASIRAAWEAAAQALDAIGPAPGAAQLRYERGQAIGVNENLRGQLAALAAERGEARALIGEILGELDPSKGDGYRARVGQVKYNQWRERAGLED